MIATTQTNNLLNEALRLASLGYRVFPLRPGKKAPFSGSHGAYDAETDLDKIDRWWTQTPSANVGIACGGGMFVLDIDTKAMADDHERVADFELLLEGFPKTQTQSGGFHFFIRSPGGVDIANSVGSLGVGLDIRSHGCYVVSPPSCGPQGAYQWLDRLDVPVGQLPDCPKRLIDLLRNITKPTKTTSGVGGNATAKPIEATPETIQRAKAYLASVPPAIEGQGGHAALLWAARCMVRGFLLNDDVAYDLLAGDYNARCSPPWEGAELDSDFMHKIADARKLPFDKPVGWLLDPEDNFADEQIEDFLTASRGARLAGQPPTVASVQSSLAGVESENSTGVVIRDLEGVKPERVSWLWPGRIPIGKITVLAGLPGLGKSVLSLDIASRVSTGAQWPDGESACGPGGVVLVSAEDDMADTVVPRLLAAGADLTKIKALDGFNNGDGVIHPVEFAHIGMFREAISRTRDCKLLIIDPVSAFVGGKADSYKDSDVRGLMAPLAKLAADAGIAVVLVAHLNKTSGGAAIHRIGGAGAWGAAARAAWLVSQSPDDPDTRVFLPLKQNLARRSDGMTFTTVDHNDSPAIAWGEDRINESADDMLRRLGDGRHNRESPKMDEAVEFLEAELSGGPVESEELKKRAEKAGQKWRTIERAKKQAGVKPHLRGAGADGVWWWSIPNTVYDV